MLIQIPDFPAHLSERDQAVMKAVLKTMTDEQWNEIGKKYDVTGNRIKQIFEKIVRKGTREIRRVSVADIEFLDEE